MYGVSWEVGAVGFILKNLELFFYAAFSFATQKKVIGWYSYFML